MFSKTEKTIRIKNIPANTTKDDVEKFAEELCGSTGSRGKAVQIFNLGWRSVTSTPLLVSLAPQAGTQTATITLPSKADKNKAVQVKEPREHWVVDDNFNSLTVFHQGEKRLVDICLVHGLEGNAFDTWAWDGTTMWLRDFLPSHESLKDARTMSFGYSSRIMDGSNMSGPPEWASGLLHEVSRVRSSAEQKDRATPIIFVAHSLGGIVVREAMIELHRNPQYYPGLQLRQCGLLFLATPHSGTTLTDWQPYLRKVTNLMGLRGEDFKKMLEAFNNMSKVSKRDFAQLPYQVPFECLHETNKTELGPLHRKVIVSADTAGLNGVSARPMLDVNHRDICKFNNKAHPGYAQITECLKRIMDRIDTTSSAPTASQPANTASETRQGTRSGVGKGGTISGNKAGDLEVSGGIGTGASMSFEDYRKELSGSNFVISGGEGLEARIT